MDGVSSLSTPGQYVQAHARLRAFLTVVIGFMEVVDDSFGCLGDSFRNGFAQYLAMPLDATGIDARVFFHDLLTLLIWEDYGLTYEQTEGYFAGLTPEKGDLCIEYVQQQMQELQDDDLDYQAEEALTLLGQVVAEQHRFDRFEEARHMGTRHWKRIIARRSGRQAAQTPAGRRSLRSGAQSCARRVLTAEIRAAEKGKMESGPEALRALESVKSLRAIPSPLQRQTHRSPYQRIGCGIVE